MRRPNSTPCSSKMGASTSPRPAPSLPSHRSTFRGRPRAPSLTSEPSAMLTRRSAITGYRSSSPRAARRWHHRGTHRMVSARTCSRPSYACAPQSQRPTRHRTRLRLLPVNDAATECALACGGHAACVSQFLRFVAVDYSATVDPVRRIVYAELAIEAQDVGLPRCALGRGGPDCKAYVTTSISSSFVVLPPTWPSGRVFDYVSRAPGPPRRRCKS